MTATHTLQRLLEGQFVPAPLVSDEVRRLVLVASLLRADARARAVTMPPLARALLRERLLDQVPSRPPLPSTLVAHGTTGRAAVSRCGGRGLRGRPRPAVR